MSSCASRFHAPQSGTKALDLLRMFSGSASLVLKQLASPLRITPQTLEEWFSDGVTMSLRDPRDRDRSARKAA